MDGRKAANLNMQFFFAPLCMRPLDRQELFLVRSAIAALARLEIEDGIGRNVFFERQGERKRFIPYQTLFL